MKEQEVKHLQDEKACLREVNPDHNCYTLMTYLQSFFLALKSFLESDGDSCYLNCERGKYSEQGEYELSIVCRANIAVDPIAVVVEL